MLIASGRLELPPEPSLRADLVGIRRRLTATGSAIELPRVAGRHADLAQDTVPFALWCVARHLGDFEEAMWRTVSGLGDRDTTCAIAGGIIAAAPTASIPSEWLDAREDLDRMSRTLIPHDSPREGGA